MKTKHLVVDTAAFVKNLPLWEYGEELYSIPEVVREIRDKQTREWYDALPVTIKLREPQAWAIKFINQFSQKTGDYASLSLVDVKLLALTYELEVEQKGSSDHLRTEPEKPVTEGPIPKADANGLPKMESFHAPIDKYDSSVSTSSDTLSENSSGDEESNNTNCSYKRSNKTPKAHKKQQKLPSALPSLSQNTMKNSSASGKIPNTSIYWRHMLGLEDYLKEHSYIGGYSPTSEDDNVWKALVKEYPQFCPSAQEQYSVIFSALQLPPPTATHRPLHSTFPCIRRWSYHIASFSMEERRHFPLSDRKLEDILHEFGTRAHNGEEGGSPVSDPLGKNTPLLDSALVVDMKALSVSGEGTTKDDDREDGYIESDDDSSSVDGENVNYDGDCEEAQENTNEDNFEVDSEGYEIENGGDDNDDDNGWITPSNIKRYKLKNNNNVPPKDEKEENVLVACVTADFAMQNILRHVGLSVMGVDGKLIWQIRTFILRCYACFKTTSNMTKLFCPNCGNKTLKKVSVTVNPDGTQKIWINYKKTINTKGMIFSLPRPKGGQHARNPILVADQKEVRQFSSKMSKKKVNPLHEDYDPDTAPFAVRDVYSRASQLGYIGGKCHNHYYWERKNPNAHIKKYKKKK